MKSLLPIFAFAFFGLQGSVLAQGTFQNLDFEAAKVTGYSPGSFGISSTNALPGWTIYFGNIGGVTNGGTGPMWYDAQSLGGALISINDTNRSAGFVPFQGNFTAGLNGDFPNRPTNAEFAAIGQTGQVPVDSESLTFWADSVAGQQVTFDGTLIPLIEVGSAANYVIVSGDISAFAGQTGQLLFTTLPNHGSLLDNIQFSPSPIPEPTTFALAALGALILGYRRKNSRG